MWKYVKLARYMYVCSVMHTLMRVRWVQQLSWKQHSQIQLTRRKNEWQLVQGVCVDCRYKCVCAWQRWEKPLGQHSELLRCVTGQVGQGAGSMGLGLGVASTAVEESAGLSLVCWHPVGPVFSGCVLLQISVSLLHGPQTDRTELGFNKGAKKSFQHALCLHLEVLKAL